MKKKLEKNKYIIIATLSLILFLIILKDVYFDEITAYDDWAYGIFVENLRSSSMTTVMKGLTFFGNAFCIIAGLILIFIFSKDKIYGYLATFNVSVVFVINNIIKAIVQRPRPSGYNIITEGNYSFPSGHSMVSTAFYGFLIYIVYKKVKNKKLKYSLIALLFALIISICISRIYLGVHYLSDTIAGFALSIAILMLLVNFIPSILGEEKGDKRGTKTKEIKS